MMSPTPAFTMENILVVEDDSFLRKMCVRHLQKDGREIRMARDGHEAIELIKQHQPDLMLLDLLMPRVDGFTVLEFMKQKKCSFPVIVLSNITWNFDARSCQKLGVADYFIKSNTDIPELVRKIEEHLAAKRAMVG